MNCIKKEGINSLFWYKEMRIVNLIFIFYYALLNVLSGQTTVKSWHQMEY